MNNIIDLINSNNDLYCIHWVFILFQNPSPFEKILGAPLNVYRTRSICQGRIAGIDVIIHNTDVMQIERNR